MLYACVSTGFKPYVIRMTTRVCPTDTMHELTEDTHTKKNTQILNTSDGRLISSFVTVPTNIANIYIYILLPLQVAAIFIQPFAMIFLDLDLEFLLLIGFII